MGRANFFIMNWSQDAFKVYLAVPLAELPGKGVKVALSCGTLTITQYGQLLLSNKLAFPTKESEMVWFIDDGSVEVDLAKAELGSWDRVFATDDKLDPAAIEPDVITDVSAFDAETQMMISQMIAGGNK